MRKHETEDLSELSVIGVDIGKDVFHLVGLMQRVIASASLKSFGSASLCPLMNGLTQIAGMSRGSNPKPRSARLTKCALRHASIPTTLRGKASKMTDLNTYRRMQRSVLLAPVANSCQRRKGVSEK